MSDDTAIDETVSREEKVVRHMCPLCEAGCGLEVHVANGDVKLIRGDRDDVHSAGFLCPKGTALKGLQHDPDRLRRPLVKRDGQFVEVSFAEAFAEVDRLLTPLRAKYGPAACGLVIGNPTVHRTGLVLYALELAAALGSPNVFSSASLDQMPKHLSVGEMFGDFYSIPVPDIERTDLLVIVGANPMVSNGSMWSVPDFRGKVKALLARGGNIITVDPRYTETSAVATQHHHIRPGTDALLLAAIVHILFDDDLVDLGRLQPHVAGFDQLKGSFADFSPERVAKRCGISSRDIRDLAHRISSAKRAALYGRLGTCLQEHATVTSWLIDVVNILTANLDEPGGVMFATPPAFAANTTGEDGSERGISTGSYQSRVSGAPEVMNQFPLACLAEEIETEGDGQIRGLLMMASNAALSAPEGPRLEKALGQLDALICLDIYVNETTRHADVIIPGPSPLEEAHYDVFFSQFAHRNTARYSPPALAKDSEVPEDWETMVRLIGILDNKGPEADLLAIDEELTRQLLGEVPDEFVEPIMAALGDRVGVERRLDLGLRSGPFGDQFGLKADGLSLDVLVGKPSGVDLGPLEPRIPAMLRTRSGKVELAPRAFLAALEDAKLLLAGPSPDCVLIGRRHLRSNNSWMHNLVTLAKGRVRCTLLIHPDDAKRWQLHDGDAARVSATLSGSWIEVPVEIDDAMMPGVVSLPHGWGHDREGVRLQVAAQRPGANINSLTSSTRRDSLSGNAALNGIAVTVKSVR